MTELKVGDLVRFKSEFPQYENIHDSIGIVVDFLILSDVTHLDVVCTNGVKRRTWDYFVEKVQDEL